MTDRKALIVGSTGLIGGYCLDALINDPNYAEVIALVRKPLPKKHRKLSEIIIKFDNLEHELANAQAHDVFCCLGTTIKKAGSQDAFREIDLTLVITVAEFMRQQGAEQFLVISALGADKDSTVFYNRVKGEMESALKELGYPYLHIIRPSLLLGTREEFRLGEKIATLLTPLFKPFLWGSLKKYRPVEAESVAQFMVKIGGQKRRPGVHIYESNMIG